MQAPTIEDLQVGTATAWMWFINEFGVPVSRYARQLGHPDPDDVAGATMETIVRCIHRFDGGHSELRSFVFSIAHARVVDELRSARSQRVVTMPQVPEVTDQLPDVGLDALPPALVSALSELSEQQRWLIHLRYSQGVSTREAAHVVGNSEGATRVILSRTMRSLRDTLGNIDRI